MNFIIFMVIFASVFAVLSSVHKLSASPTTFPVDDPKEVDQKALTADSTIAESASLNTDFMFDSTESK